MAGTWGRPLPPSPRTPGHCPPHAVGTSSPGPDRPECLMLRGRLTPGPAGLRWGHCGSVSTCLCGALQGHGGSSGFVSPVWLCPRSSRDPAVGALGRGLGVCHVGCVASPLPAEPGPSTERHALNRSHGPPSGITRHSGCPAGQSRRVSSPTLSRAVAASCCRPACAAAGRPRRHPRASVSLLSPLSRVPGRLPSSCRPQRVRSPSGRLARVARGSEDRVYRGTEQAWS